MSASAVSRLRPDEIDAVYVLARLGYAGVSRWEWRDRIAALLARPEAEGGVLAARDAAGRAVGLLVYQITSTPSGGRALQVERMIGFDLTDPDGVADALIEDLLRRGRAAGCDSLALIQPIGAPRDVAARLRRAELSALHRVF